MSKQGDVTPSVSFPEDYEQFLAEHVDPAQRKSSSWPVMNQWLQLFKTHELPLESMEQVSTGLSILAFKLKVASLPRGSDIPGLIFNLHCYANEFTGDLLQAMQSVTDDNAFQRKRKRLKANAEEEQFLQIMENVN